MLDEEEYIGFAFLLVLGLALGGFFYWKNRTPDEPVRWTGPLEVLPSLEELELDMDKVALGRRLYHDGILSGDGSVSCATCHNVEAGGAEPRRTSFGVNNAVGPINAPTTLNAWSHIAQFWDGRASDLQDQAGGPVENPGEMATTFATVIPRIEGDEWYGEKFAAVYGDRGVSKDTITDAIAEYERSLITPAPFDAWHAGDDSAMTEDAVAGYRLFADVGCTSCHTGPAIGGASFQKMGLVNDYFERRGGELTEADMGRFNHTGDEADRHFFRVPTLRNIALTAPYFHDGSESDLGGAVRTMAHVQLGRDLEDGEVNQIVAFLESLTGELPAHARMPNDEVPPERFYEMPAPYDLRLSKHDGGLFVTGAVPSEEIKAQIEAAIRAKVRGADTSGLVVDADAEMVSPETLDVAIGKALDAFSPLDRARVDFTMRGDNKFMSFMGEGNAEAMAAAEELLSELPEGFEWKEPVRLYDAAEAEACDQALAALQGEHRIEFDTGSSDLTAESREMLAGTPELLASCPANLRLHVAGHTDNVGNPGSNLRLSRRRAASVLDTLVGAGVEPGRLISHGYGETKPIAPNDTEEGRSQNRRISLSLYREY